MAWRDWFRKPETRSAGSYTDAAIAYLVEQAGGVALDGKGAAPIQAAAEP